MATGQGLSGRARFAWATNQLKPRTLAGLAQQMRGNLAGLWRVPAEQERNKTKRKKKDKEPKSVSGALTFTKLDADGHPLGGPIPIGDKPNVSGDVEATVCSPPRWRPPRFTRSLRDVVPARCRS